MSLVPAAQILVDFGSDGAGTDSVVADPRNCGSDDSNAGDDAAYRRGLAEASTKLRAEFETRLSRVAADHQDQLDAERRSWAGGFAKQIEGALSSGLHDMEAEIGRMTANILKPFLSAALRRHATQELAATLGPLLSGQSGIALQIHGPEELLELLRGELAGRLDDATFHPGEAPDLRVTIGQMTLETQLAAWAAKLDEALE